MQSPLYRLMVLPPYIRKLAPYLDIEVVQICTISISCKVDSDWNLLPVCDFATPCACKQQGAEAAWRELDRFAK